MRRTFANVPRLSVGLSGWLTPATCQRFDPTAFLADFRRGRRRQHSLRTPLLICAIGWQMLASLSTPQPTAPHVAAVEQVFLAGHHPADGRVALRGHLGEQIDVHLHRGRGVDTPDFRE